MSLVSKFREVMAVFRYSHAMSELESKNFYLVEDGMDLFPGTVWEDIGPSDSCSGIVLLQDCDTLRIFSCYFDFRVVEGDRTVWILHSHRFTDSDYVFVDKIGLFDWVDKRGKKFSLKKCAIF